jgi:NADPH-dependent 2,4-dienoyl-CoA reductase/sulfur reductase-like enzyme
VIVGGGFIGVEMAEQLRHRGLDVTLVELADQLSGPADSVAMTGSVRFTTARLHS